MSKSISGIAERVQCVKDAVEMLARADGFDVEIKVRHVRRGGGCVSRPSAAYTDALDITEVAARTFLEENAKAVMSLAADMARAELARALAIVSDGELPPPRTGSAWRIKAIKRRWASRGSGGAVEDPQDHS